MEATIAKVGVTNPLVTIGLREFMNANDFKKFGPEVKQNVSGYPYVIFQKADGTSENIYFSTGSSKGRLEGDKIVKGYFENLRIAEVLNASGETRIKLVRTNEGIDMDDIL